MPYRWREPQEQEVTSVERRSAVEGAVEVGALAQWSRGLGLTKESANGRANHRLTSDE
jgi:hypothetical protein